MKIDFIGATQEVTGSMTLLTFENGKALIDSGMYQGPIEIVKKNKNPLPFNPKEISAIILTHAHLDHSGFIPRLVKLGFRGTIFCTKPTMKLAKVIMSDSSVLLEKQKDHILHNFYEKKDAMVATSLFKTKEFHESFELLGARVEFIPAGHILGAVSVVITEGESKTVFSGDLGRLNDPIIEPFELCPPANTVIIESTYGGRNRHGDIDVDLKKFLEKVKNESKIGIIASFAVARAQLLITLITKFYHEYPDQKVRVVIDSPMMVAANAIYKEFAELTRIPLELKNALSEVEVITHMREWDSIAKKEGPLIVISSSGMLMGGRIWRYLENWQDDPNACLFLPGYQGEGTPGKLLSEGQRVVQNEDGKKIHWQGEVICSDAFSSHADQDELLTWLKGVSLEAQIYINHGDEDSKLALLEKLVELGYRHVDHCK